MNEIIHIKTPFYTAGKIYGWKEKPIGLGINLKFLKGEGTLKVTVGENPQIWVIDKESARNFIKEHKSESKRSKE